MKNRRAGPLARVPPRLGAGNPIGQNGIQKHAAINVT
jgi:hypothetical protein